MAMSKVSRRSFLKITAGLGAAGSLVPLRSLFSGSPFKGLSAAPLSGSGTGKKPLVISTWKHGVPANDAAWKILSAGGPALDAVEAGVRVPEGDPSVNGVGFGGLPDEECRVTLDASIMGSDGRAGAVAFIENYRHPISIARTVMETTDHVFIVGEGAEEFARKQGFSREELLTEAAREAWIKWKQGMSDKDDWFPKDLDHDTIGMVAIDAAGNLAGACTTSGLAFKIHGRVGDSPIIGAGMSSRRAGAFSSSRGFGRGSRPRRRANGRSRGSSNGMRASRSSRWRSWLSRRRERSERSRSRRDSSMRSPPAARTS
jgi:N4-(beta-N-acetylglucosaminyl)-L-asparaginase